ncbi:autotransporter outer membrane beta-barrel domain-containing protein [Pseudomonas psychrophila]|uniref:autotransporter outer membrane beta-barrel domain-containing protein n=1 Tax=Pseudomonas psychrophila TaxID=122355 RepID=UPI000AC43E10|nr:autotransporter outer membrane beta-barrel domain-containing protein [Pseudomonas psychrophila]
MDLRLTPLALAICASLMYSANVWAAGGAAGANGDITTSPNEFNSGAPGTSGALANGGNGADFLNQNTLDLTQDLGSVSDGSDGQDATNAQGGGGNGGAGGGSAFGAFSQGGAGGTSTTDSNGGNGGDIAGKTISQSNAANISLAGTDAGNGGSGGADNGGGLSGGGGGQGGAGGGSIFGGLSQGGAGGFSDDATNPSAVSFSAGGSGGAISDMTMTLSNITLNGALGGNGGSGGNSDGASGSGGVGGGSIFAGLSQGGAGGLSFSTTTALSSSAGGFGGAISGITMTLSDITLNGARGGAGGNADYNFGASGNGGAGGGSIFGGLSQGGAGGFSDSNSNSDSSSAGGSGGAISDITMTLSNVTLNGALGGNAGNSSGSASGIGGAGGGSIFGGLSQGGAGGSTYSFSNTSSAGGSGGAISDISMTLSNITLNGVLGGNGGVGGVGAGGSGGAGGGSIFGGLSQGGAGGYSISSFDASADGGNGGNGGAVSGNTLLLSDVRLIGAPGGTGQTGSDGINGGSILGGYSAGGAAGEVFFIGPASQTSAIGGAGGDSSSNTIKLGGVSSLTGDIYGGYSQGGRANGASAGVTGAGGNAENNHVTLTGTELSIAGAVYGGYSADGDGTLQPNRAFSGNTLTLNGYRGSVKGIYNFEQYNWLLPKDVVNQDTLIKITGSDKVDLNNTQHTVAMVSDGNRLNEGDKVILIDKAQGTSSPASVQVEQGHFIIYDAQIGIENDAFVLNIDSKSDTTPLPPSPAGRLNPKSESFLQGRAAALAFTNQGTDMIRESLSSCVTDMFFITDGGTNRYDTGSHIRIRDFKMALGLRKCFELQNTSQVVFGAFIDHGQGNYDSYNSFVGYGDVRGSGDLRYTGAGLLFHMDVAGTSINKNAKPVTGIKEGVYLDAVMRAGRVKTDFSSNDLIDAEGVRGHYNSKSQYVSAMAGIGYVFNLDDQQSVDVYSRYSWSHINADKVMVGNDKLSFDRDNSSRLRAGTRYTYAVTQHIAPYAGLAYEHEFEGKVSGKVYDMSIKGADLGGSTGILEVGVSTTPIASVSAIKLDVGVQGFFGERKGATGSINLSYEY